MNSMNDFLDFLDYLDFLDGGSKIVWDKNFPYCNEHYLENPFCDLPRTFFLDMDRKNIHHPSAFYEDAFENI